MRLKRFNEEFEWDEILNNNREESELDKWSSLEKDLMGVVEKYKGQFGSDSYAVIDAVYQVMDGMFQKKESKEEKELEIGFDVKSLENEKDEEPSIKTSTEDQEKTEKEFKKQLNKIEKFESFITISIVNDNDYDVEGHEEESEEVGCGCCSDCNGQEDCECCSDCSCGQMEQQPIEQQPMEPKVMNILDFINSITNK